VNPRLRSDIVVEGATLRDPVLNREIKVAGIAAELVRRLDGTRGLEAIAAELGAPLARLEASYRRLLHLNLVEGAGDQVLARIARLRAGTESLEQVVLPETRFGCIGSGDCCQSYHLGTLTDADLALLDRLPLREQFPHLEPPYWFERALRDGTTGRYLKTTDFRCVFLRDDCRCGLHAAFGAENKPSMCRTYPFEEYVTFDGAQVYNVCGCSEFSTTSRAGAPLAEQLPTLLPVMRRAPLTHPVTILDDQVAVDFGYVQPVLRAAVEELRTPRAGAPELLRALARRLSALSRGLQSCPLTPSGPTQALEAVLSPSPPDDCLRPGDSREGAAAVARIAVQTARAVTEIISENHLARDEHYSGRQSKELIPILQMLAELAAHRADPSLELSPYAREVAAVDATDPELDEVLCISLREQLFGGAALLQDRTDAGLLRLAFGQLVALWGGRLRALVAGRARVEPKDLDRPHMLAERVMGMGYIARTFVDDAATAPPVLEALPALARWR
jgi:Fe-S-cluster containining protein